MSVAAVIPAAGRGKRLGAGKPKAFYPVLGIPLLIHTLRFLRKARFFSEMLVAVHPRELSMTQKILKKYHMAHVRVVAGGATRAESVCNAVMALEGAATHVLVHDAARPLASARLVRDVIHAAMKADGAVAAIPVSSTVKKAKAGGIQIDSTVDRSSLYLAQTPQVFKITSLKNRYRVLGAKIRHATDEAALFDGTRAQIRLSQGDVRNIKITTPEDVELMKLYLKQGI